MFRRSLLPLVLTAAIVVAAVNVGVAAWSRRLPYAVKLESIRTARDPNLLAIGNSLLDRHLDEAAFAQAAAAHGEALKPINAALAASEPPEQRLLFDYATSGHPGIRTLVVGMYDFQLTKPDQTRLADLVGNRMVGIDHRFPFGEVASVYGFGTLDRIRLRLLRALPMAAHRANMWKNVELLRRAMAQVGMPHAAVNSMGRVDDFALLEARSPEAFDAQARAFIEQPDHFNPSYDAIFDKAHRAGIDVAIVVMPMSPAHQYVFYSRPLWRQYFAAIRGLAGLRGIRVIDLSAMFSGQDDFADRLHMTQQSAHLFSIRLADALAQPANR
jgi:hypothetical protein